MYFSKAIRVLIRRHYSIIFFCLIGGVLSSISFIKIDQYEQQIQRHQFETTFKDKLTSLTQAISAIDKVFYATQSMLEITPKLTKKDFSNLINKDFLANTGMQGMEWAPAIANEQVSHFEKTIRREGIFDYRIWAINAQLHSCIADEKNIFFPILFAEPADKVGHELGFQLSSDCVIASSMRESLETKNITSSRFYSNNNEMGLRLLKPLFNLDTSLRGYLVGIVMINQLVDTLWGDITRSNNHQLSISNSSEKNQPIYESQWLIDCSDNCREKTNHLYKSADIPFANQVWHVEFSQIRQPEYSSYYAYATVFFIIILTLGLSCYMWTYNNRFHWANKIVHQRTKSLQHQAIHDNLTQLFNKQELTLRLTELTNQDESDIGFSLLFIDLDHFKKINDTMGHLVGDKLLQQVAQRLLVGARTSDLIFRFGGDEFVIILNNQSSESAVLQIAERILYQIQREYIIDDAGYRIGASIGASIITDSNSSCSEIIRNADIAMYEAKKLGRGKIIFFNTNMYKHLMHRQEIENELNKAIYEGELNLYFQPIHKNNGLKGFEALARWQHPEKGTILPDDFINIAEETGLIHHLGNWVIDSACTQISILKQQYGSNHCPYISINVSPLQLARLELVNQVRAALTLHNLPGKLLAIELTESALIENKKIIKQNLAQLRELGVQIFLDDFGTGYSSLSILQDFPIDVLKIDRSFIIGVDDNNLDSQNLVKAMIKMAQALNMEIVSEGVENLTTYNWLQKENCDLMQGYYFSKPLPEHALQDYIQQYIASQSFAKISISTVI